MKRMQHILTPGCSASILRSVFDLIADMVWHGSAFWELRILVAKQWLGNALNQRHKTVAKSEGGHNRR